MTTLAQPRLRVATLDDYPRIQRLESEQLPGTLAAREFRALFLDNPLWPRLGRDWPLGWVFEDERGEIVGSIGNIPSEYAFRGERYVCANGRSWVITPDYRAYALMLMDEYYQQPGADLFVNTTVGPDGAATADLFATRVPRGDWQTYAFAVARYHPFARSALAKKGIPGALSAPAAAALWLSDRATAASIGLSRADRAAGTPAAPRHPERAAGIPAAPRHPDRAAGIPAAPRHPDRAAGIPAAPRHPDRAAGTTSSGPLSVDRMPVRERFDVEPLYGFDDRFDGLWAELLARHPDTLLGVRDAATLRWHYGPLLRSGQLRILAATSGGLPRAYLILRRRTLPDGLRALRIVDYRSVSDGDPLPALLRAALRAARADGDHIVEHLGRELPGFEAFDRFAPHRFPRKCWSYYYRAPHPVLAEALTDPAAWDPSEYDGDASLY